jgi:hypothetical protein
MFGKVIGPDSAIIIQGNDYVRPFLEGPPKAVNPTGGIALGQNPEVLTPITSGVLAAYPHYIQLFVSGKPESKLLRILHHPYLVR